MELGPDVALIAGLMGEPARAAILAALVGGRALPAGELAFIGNVAPQTASFHLRKLMDAALITLEKQGKHSYYRLANERVAATLESLAALAPVRSEVDLRSGARHESERILELRFARSCYRHLAGALAVQITLALLDRKFLVAHPGKIYSLTGPGQEWCRQLGMLLPESGRRTDPPGRACLDWTERRHHLGGALGVALLSRLTELRWMVTNPESRAVHLTHAGEVALERQLGITISR
jgi:DNA-binding transcriptional ArsR family regulator